MMIYLYIGILIVSVSFAILAIYLAKLLSSVSKSMDDLGNTLSEVEQQLHGITKETEEMVQETHLIVDDVKEKTDALTPVFHSLHGLGSSLIQLNRSIEGVPSTLRTYTADHSVKVTEAYHWGTTAMSLYQKWKMTKQQTQV
ncbi:MULTISPECIES: DUF948 domain-containing protein [Pontibacillus]|uniref:DUF948 domain-containing protein n=1 Tax=Pontibacillus chungwhensis TaxID=265426 RepID=A0ABY8V4D2_9BACI|nr:MULTISPECIES: DUF948 domain-containing protein [Pontibacillus]MCD5322418.1 DUF948 domain-containing protein [Pontibacillus sp. HN14]WIF99704.1 DUF948 domain-containing protein [Pontibacillus chungwhensis]